MIVERILKSSRGATLRRTTFSVFGCLVEEVGELSRALNRPERCDEPAISELADVMNCVVDLAYTMKAQELAERGFDVSDPDVKMAITEQTTADLVYYVNKKCTKWDSFMEQRPTTRLPG